MDKNKLEESVENSDDIDDINWNDVPDEWYDDLNECTGERDKLNDDQKKIFDYIDRHIQQNKEFRNTNDFETLKIFITGGAGTGKTFLLNALYKYILSNFGDGIMKSAYTGMAASHIDGQTLHKTFLINKAFPFDSYSKDKYYKYASSSDLKAFTKLFQSIKFLIIDEISMVSSEVFEIINDRLQFVLKSNKLFANINVIVFGDLLQLPPIEGRQIYKSNLWKNFEFYELQQNMRQNDNKIFINLLNNVRTGQVSEIDLKMMKKKYYESEFHFGDNLIRIYPTNKLVQDYNEQILKHFKDKNETIYTFEASDEFPDGVKPKTINEIHGMPRTIKLFRGARVMLRKNLCVAAKLVNGRIGTVVDCFPENNQIEVQFDNDEKHYKFGYKIFEEFDIIRNALPFILCFACTVHKLQGCTLDKAVIYLGKQHFQAGQIYVALSRVRKLEDFQIEFFDHTRFIRNNLIDWNNLKELKRLRQLYRIR